MNNDPLTLGALYEFRKKNGGIERVILWIPYTATTNGYEFIILYDSWDNFFHRRVANYSSILVSSSRKVS